MFRISILHKKNMFFFLRVVVVVLWLCMLTMLVQREMEKRSFINFDRQYIQRHIEEKEHWAGIYFNNKKIGYTQSSIKKIEEGYQIYENIFLDMTIMSVPQQVYININSVADKNLYLKIFSFKLKSGLLQVTAYGSAEGTALRVIVDTMGGTQKKTLQLKQPPIMASSLKYAVMKEGIKVGAVLNRTIFDPATMDFRPIHVHVESLEELILDDHTYQCYKIRQQFNGIDVYTWIDEHGEILKEESPTGLIMIREDEKKARGGGWEGKQDMIESTAIKTNTSLVNESLVHLKIRLKNVPLDGFTLHDGRQQMNGNCITVTRENIKHTDTYNLPHPFGGMEDFLKAEPYIEIDDDTLRSTAATIIRPTKDAQQAVRMIAQWVYKNIEKRPSISLPSARAVLKTKFGDCNEHAVLFVGLCRAVGIPARVCAGIVYMRGSFYYHAWAEVFLKSWVTVDPTLNQFPADVTHIKFIHGSLGDQVSLLKIIGKLSVDILEYL